MQVEGVSKIASNEIKIDLGREKDDIRKYLNRIHAESKMDQRHIIRGLPPVRR